MVYKGLASDFIRFNIVHIPYYQSNITSRSTAYNYPAPKPLRRVRLSPHGPSGAKKNDFVDERTLKNPLSSKPMDSSTQNRIEHRSDPPDETFFSFDMFKRDKLRNVNV